MAARSAPAARCAGESLMAAFCAPRFLLINIRRRGPNELSRSLKFKLFGVLRLIVIRSGMFGAPFLAKQDMVRFQPNFVYHSELSNDSLNATIQYDEIPPDLWTVVMKGLGGVRVIFELCDGICCFYVTRTGINHR